MCYKPCFLLLGAIFVPLMLYLSNARNALSSDSLLSLIGGAFNFILINVWSCLWVQLQANIKWFLFSANKQK